MKMLIDNSANCLPNGILDNKVMASTKCQVDDGKNFPFSIEHEKSLSMTQLDGIQYKKPNSDSKILQFL